MIKAIKNENIYHSVLNYEDIIEDKNNFRCVNCDEEVIFVDSIAKQKHFRHKVESACSFEPETKEHIEMKEFLRLEFGLNVNEFEVRVEDKEGKYVIADGLMQQEGKMFALEVQASPLSLKDMLDKTFFYNNQDIYTCWIFHENLLNEEYISETIKEWHKICYGRVFIYRNLVDKSYIYPLHMVRRIKEVQTIFDEVKEFKYKKKVNFDWGTEVSSLDFSTQYFNNMKTYFPKLGPYISRRLYNKEIMLPLKIAIFDKDNFWWKSKKVKFEGQKTLEE